jgi:hypothetical protein
MVRENAMGEIESVSFANIRLSQWSITSLFIALRTHLLANGAEQKADDPQAWAHSLFYTVKPRMFRARVREGRIRGLTAKDTFSSETWELLVGAGVGRESGALVCRPNEVNGILAQIREGSFEGYTEPVNQDDDFSEDDDEDVLSSDDNLDDEEEFDIEDVSETDATEHRPSEIAMEAIADMEAAGEFDGSPAEVAAAQADEAMTAALAALPITRLRKASRGRVSGGYDMSKGDLARKLALIGVTVDQVPV